MISFSNILLGGAIGDAFGSYYEGQDGPIAYVDHDNWILTDDTVLTVATAEAMLGTHGLSIDTIADKFVQYFNEQKIIRMGASTLKALIDLANGIDPRDSGAIGDKSGGNGPASRISPLFILDLKSYEDRKIIRNVCRITHKHEESYCGALAVLAAIQNKSGSFIDSALTVIPDSDTKDKLKILSGLTVPIGKASQLTGVSGYTAESVPLALYAASRGCEIGFKRAIIEISCCGGDADTIASIAGQIMAAHGIDLPSEWVDRIPDLESIIHVGKQFDSIHCCK